jgi:hypothetical protein
MWKKIWQICREKLNQAQDVSNIYLDELTIIPTNPSESGDVSS